MKRMVLIVIGILIVIAFTPNVECNKSTGHGNNVVLNELHPGEFHGDWVELYNPTENSIDVAGWEITSRCVKRRGVNAYIFPTNQNWTKINSGSFLLIDEYELGFNFMEHKLTTVKLRDDGNRCIDQTKFHKIHPRSSWCRISPGFDTNSKSDWYEEFNPTPGF